MHYTKPLIEFGWKEFGLDVSKYDEYDKATQDKLWGACDRIEIEEATIAAAAEVATCEEDYYYDDDDEDEDDDEDDGRCFSTREMAADWLRALFINGVNDRPFNKQEYYPELLD